MVHPPNGLACTHIDATVQRKGAGNPRDPLRRAHETGPKWKRTKIWTSHKLVTWLQKHTFHHSKPYHTPKTSIVKKSKIRKISRTHQTINKNQNKKNPKIETKRLKMAHQPSDLASSHIERRDSTVQRKGTANPRDTCGEATTLDQMKRGEKRGRYIPRSGDAEMWRRVRGMVISSAAIEVLVIADTQQIAPVRRENNNASSTTATTTTTEGRESSLSFGTDQEFRVTDPVVMIPVSYLCTGVIGWGVGINSPSRTSRLDSVTARFLRAPIDDRQYWCRFSSYRWRPLKPPQLVIWPILGLNKEIKENSYFSKSYCEITQVNLSF